MARLFAPLDHHFRIAGAIRADHYVGGSNEVDALSAPTPVGWTKVPFVDLPVEDLDPDEVIRRLRAHKPILRSKT